MMQGDSPAMWSVSWADVNRYPPKEPPPPVWWSEDWCPTQSTTSLCRPSQQEGPRRGLSVNHVREMHHMLYKLFCSILNTKWIEVECMLYCITWRCARQWECREHYTHTFTISIVLLCILYLSPSMPECSDHWGCSRAHCRAQYCTHQLQFTRAYWWVIRAHWWVTIDMDSGSANCGTHCGSRHLHSGRSSVS